MAESSSSSVHDEMDLEDQQQRQQTASPLIRLSRHASLTEDSSYTNGKEQYEKILPSSSQDVPSSSTASSLPISASRYREAWVSVMIFLLGWKIPKIVQERTIPSEPPPYQVLEKSGDVVLDLGLSFPLVEPPTIPGTSVSRFFSASPLTHHGCENKGWTIVINFTTYFHFFRQFSRLDLGMDSPRCSSSSNLVRNIIIVDRTTGASDRHCHGHVEFSHGHWHFGIRHTNAQGRHTTSPTQFL